MTKPGRNAQGQFIRDDATIRECLGGLAFAIRALAEAMHDLAMDATTRQRLAHDADTLADQVLTALPSLDVGERPKREIDIERRTRFDFSTKEPL